MDGLRRVHVTVEFVARNVVWSVNALLSVPICVATLPMQSSCSIRYKLFFVAPNVPIRYLAFDGFM